MGTSMALPTCGCGVRCSWWTSPARPPNGIVRSTIEFAPVDIELYPDEL